MVEGLMIAVCGSVVMVMWWCDHGIGGGRSVWWCGDGDAVMMVAAVVVSSLPPRHGVVMVTWCGHCHIMVWWWWWLVSLLLVVVNKNFKRRLPGHKRRSGRSCPCGVIGAREGWWWWNPSISCLKQGRGGGVVAVAEPLRLTYGARWWQWWNPSISHLERGRMMRVVGRQNSLRLAFRAREQIGWWRINRISNKRG
jgi:hypothetical protein